MCRGGYRECVFFFHLNQCGSCPPCVSHPYFGIGDCVVGNCVVGD